MDGDCKHGQIKEEDVIYEVKAEMVEYYEEYDTNVFKEELTEVNVDENLPIKHGKFFKTSNFTLSGSHKPTKSQGRSKQSRTLFHFVRYVHFHRYYRSVRLFPVLFQIPRM